MGLFGLSRPPLKTMNTHSDYTDPFVPTSDSNALREMARYWNRHVKNHIFKLDATMCPDIFFESYYFILDNLEKSTIAAPIVHVKAANRSQDIIRWKNAKEELIAEFLERYFNNIQSRTAIYKSEEARQLISSEFRFSLAPHMEQLTPKLQQQVEEYCQRLLKAE